MERKDIARAPALDQHANSCFDENNPRSFLKEVGFAVGSLVGVPEERGCMG
jgi:hypothetical protein